MSRVKVRLFGRLSIHCNEQLLTDLRGAKVQELFCYLLLHRDRPHPRETLAGLLWGDIPTVQAKKYLRQALWQLQKAFDMGSTSPPYRLLHAEGDSVCLDVGAELWLDVAIFEAAARAVRGVAGGALNLAQVALLREAAALYRGDLLEGWYEDWCLLERDRLQVTYLAMLDKLMEYCEVHRQYEEGLACGTCVLRHDRARESTHQQLMRLHYLAGNRAAALRQYQQCVAALEQELGVQPAEETTALYRQVRFGRLERLVSDDGAAASPRSEAGGLPDALGQLQRVEAVLAGLQQQVRGSIRAVREALATGAPVPERQPALQKVVAVKPVKPAANGRR